MDNVNMTWVWWGVAVVVAVFGVGLTSFEDLPAFIEHRDEIVAFVAGYTLPLVVGAAVLTIAYLKGWINSTDEWWHHAGYIGGTLWAAAALSAWLGLGLSPFEVAIGGLPMIEVSYPPIVVTQILLLAVAAYLNAYGWGLSLAGAAIGGAVGLQVVKWFGE